MHLLKLLFTEYAFNNTVLGLKILHKNTHKMLNIQKKKKIKRLNFRNVIWTARRYRPVYYMKCEMDEVCGNSTGMSTLTHRQFCHKR